MANRKRKKKNRSILLIFAEILGVLLVCFLIFKVAVFSYDFSKDYFGTVSEGTGEMVEITIPEGATTADIADILEENGLIRSTLAFKLESRAEGYDGTYMQGTYQIEKGIDSEEIMLLLQKGVVYEEGIKITIPEGYTVKQIAATLEEKGVVRADDFINEVNNGTFEYDFLPEDTDRPYRLEGYLFPATYQISKDAVSRDIIVMMLDRFEIAYNNILASYEGEYTADQLVTIASLIESEIQVEDERATASGVIYNRLNEGMKLQIDSSVQYALSTRNEVVTYNDLEVDSPYNTYKYAGLPKGPICNPGEPSLEAAVNPENNKYLYYVVKERGSGEHVFAETYDEFLAAKEKYQQSFNNTTEN